MHIPLGCFYELKIYKSTCIQSIHYYEIGGGGQTFINYIVLELPLRLITTEIALYNTVFLLILPAGTEAHISSTAQLVRYSSFLKF